MIYVIFFIFVSHYLLYHHDTFSTPTSFHSSVVKNDVCICVLYSFLSYILIYIFFLRLYYDSTTKDASKKKPVHRIHILLSPKRVRFWALITQTLNYYYFDIYRCSKSSCTVPRQVKLDLYFNCEIDTQPQRVVLVYPIRARPLDHNSHDHPQHSLII